MPFCLISEVIHPRVNNFNIKQKRHGIFALLYTTNTRQDLGKLRLTKHSKFRAKHKFFFVKTER